MAWNFDYAIPSFIILSFFLIYYFIKPNLLVRSNKYFLILVIVEIFGFFSDILSSYSDSHSTDFYRYFLIFLNGFYFILFIVRHYIVSLYFASLLQIKTRKDVPTIITTILIIGIILAILINPLFEKLYIVTTQGHYLRGKYYLIIYFISFITLALDIYYIIKFRKRLTSAEIVSSLFSVLALLAGSLMKIFFMEYLLIDMFFLFVIVALFLSFENPEIYIEKKTNLYNQQAFNDVISEYFFRNKKIAMLTFSIKNYAEKREIYGSRQMDAALREIGKYFKTTFPTKKIFYLRNGRITIVENNTVDFNKIRTIVSEKFKHPWAIHHSQLHLNIAFIEMDNNVKIQAKEDVYACFRIAINQLKNSIDNYIAIDKTYFDEISHSRKVSIALNKALINNDLLLYLQPIIDSKTNKIIAAEALVRLYDEELGLVPPIEFISMAEKNGSIEALGNQVLSKVCEFIKESNIVDYGIEWINVNLSPIQCQNTQLPNNIDSIVDKLNINHDYIHLEITEDSMIDSQILKRQMNLLITDGYDFSLDDFGTGFSNITRLKMFPFNNIKLDMSIVRDHFNSPDNILPSFIQAFKDRGLSVTAEGVETEEMSEGLRKMGCDYLQGYYFSKPIPTGEFERLVKSTD